MSKIICPVLRPKRLNSVTTKVSPAESRSRNSSIRRSLADLRDEMVMATQKDGLNRTSEFGKGFVGRMMNIALQQQKGDFIRYEICPFLNHKYLMLLTENLFDDNEPCRFGGGAVKFSYRENVPFCA